MGCLCRWPFRLMLMLFLSSFLSNSQVPLLQACWSLLEVHSRSCSPGYHQQRLQNSEDCCLFLPLEASSQRHTCQMPARALLYEVSPRLEACGVRDPLEEAVCPLAELECCAQRSTALLRASRQECLCLLKLCPQAPLPPGAVSQRDGSFVYKPLTGAAAFVSEILCPERRNLEK